MRIGVLTFVTDESIGPAALAPPWRSPSEPRDATLRKLDELATELAPLCQ